MPIDFNKGLVFTNDGVVYQPFTSSDVKELSARSAKVADIEKNNMRFCSGFECECSCKFKNKIKLRVRQFIKLRKVLLRNWFTDDHINLVREISYCNMHKDYGYNPLINEYRTRERISK